MTENKNARPIAPTTGQANGNAVSNFQNHFTVSAERNQSKISDYLSRGQENSVSLQQLQLWTGLDGRTIRQRIADERFKGIPILADNQTGYFLPATEEERKRCVQSMRRRAKEIYRAAQAIETADISKGISTRRHPINGLEEQTAVAGWFDGR